MPLILTCEDGHFEGFLGSHRHHLVYDHRQRLPKLQEKLGFPAETVNLLGGRQGHPRQREVIYQGNRRWMRVTFVFLIFWWEMLTSIHTYIHTKLFYIPTFYQYYSGLWWRYACWHYRFATNNPSENRVVASNSCQLHFLFAKSMNLLT